MKSLRGLVQLITALLFCLVKPVTAFTDETLALADDDSLLVNISLEYAHDTTAKGRCELLKYQLSCSQKHGYGLYYSFLERAEPKDFPNFKCAFRWAKNADALIYLGEYIKEEAAKKSPAHEHLTVEMREALRDKYLSVPGGKFAPLIPEFREVARDNAKALVSALKKIYVVNDTVFDFLGASGAVFGLKLLGEKGFALILDSITQEKEQSFAYMMVVEFGADAAVPLLQLYENPAASQFQKNLAIKLITTFLPRDDAVIGKVVQGFQRDRNFQARGLKGDTLAFRRIVKNCLFFGGDQDAAIELMATLDFPRAKPILEQLNPEKISPAARAALFRVCSPLPQSRVKASPKEKFVFFRQLWLECSPKYRENMLYGINGFPPDSLTRFYLENFAKFTEREKRTVIFNCGEGSALEPDFPLVLRDSVYKVIRPLCNSVQKKDMDSYLRLKKKAKTKAK